MHELICDVNYDVCLDAAISMSVFHSRINLLHMA